MTPTKILSGPYSLDWLKVQITRTCPLKCSFCSQADWRSSQVIDVQKLIRVLLARVDVRLVIITGGEPLAVQDDLLELLRYCQTRGAETGVFTNAVLASPALVTRLADAGLAWARVTINGSCAEIHERSYPKGSFVRTMAGLQALSDGGIKVKARATISQANAADVSELVDWVASVGCIELDLRPYLPLGDCNPHEQFVLSPEELLRVGGQVFGLRPAYPNLKLKLLPGWSDFVSGGDGAGTPLEECACARRYLYCSADGELMPCAGHRAAVGTLDEAVDLAKLWASSALLNRMRSYRQADYCLRCPVRVQCHRSSCALVNFEVHGTFDGEVNPLCPIRPLSPEDPVLGLERSRAIFEAARATVQPSRRRTIDQSSFRRQAALVPETGGDL